LKRTEQAFFELRNFAGIGSVPQIKPVSNNSGPETNNSSPMAFVETVNPGRNRTFKSGQGVYDFKPLHLIRTLHCPVKRINIINLINKWSGWNSLQITLHTSYTR